MFGLALPYVQKIKGTAKLLLDFAKLQGKVVYKKLYYNSHYPSQVCIKDILEILDFESVDVPDSSLNSADHRLVADCVRLFAPQRSNIPKILILVSGDRDYAGLIAILQAMGKKVIVFAQKGSASPKLMRLVGRNNFYFVDELPELMRNKTQITVTDIK
ncbi:NYN domain-containing protein [Nostoc sp. FACHB-152]|uniref:NYN domain-containing protein n=1 Tax=unclassified Nostoc TaxID=2593658 RepID=UPI001685352D|nr:MULTISPECIES: NYN domain-containing protein [unclassified Nostoc]MBD2447643.1 NYN domain-containing protein [Nostoc sp. FACHB-152]MBD2470634.1 NYN domain-containing protein [Nostoc sp. FACHB-145]